MELIYRYDPYAPVSRAVPADAAAAIEALRQGNARFAEIVAAMQRRTMGEAAESPIVVPISPLSLGLPRNPGRALDQAPFALVLGCSDARVPLEIILDQSFNDLFVLRVAGNVLGVECLGTIDFAMRSFSDSLRLVAVLGHSGCGAVTAAVDGYLAPTDYSDIAHTHALRSLVDRVLIAVRVAAKALGNVAGAEVAARPGYRTALLETAVYVNAAVTSFDVRREIASLGGTAVRVVYGVYDLETLRVHSLPLRIPFEADSPSLTFVDPPRSADAFGDLAERVARAVVETGVLERESKPTFRGKS